MDSSHHPQLLTIVEVPPDDKVLCAQPGCGHSVWKAIHVVRDGAELLVLGSTCFEKRYGSGRALGSPSYGGGNSRKLTPEERTLLVENTEAFMGRIEAEEERLRTSALALAEAQQPSRRTRWIDAAPSTYAAYPMRHAPVARALVPCPWPWMKPGTSLGYFELTDGSGWVRVQRTDGQQVLVPWPAEEGWDEALPAHLGTPSKALRGYVLFDVFQTVEYLRKIGKRDCVFDSWKRLHAETAPS